MADQLLISVDEVAMRLAISRRSVQSLIAGAELPSVVIGRRRLVAVVDLEVFVDRLRERDQVERGLVVVGGRRSRTG